MRPIFIVIVLYKIHLKDAISYQTLIKPNQLSEFMVYDNSPETFHQLTEEFPEGVTYVRDCNNGGLSKAYNVGARKARELGYERILLLDQDTHFDKNLWNAYMDNLHFDGIVAPIIKTSHGEDFSPVAINDWNLKGLPQPQAGEHSLYEMAVVNSGCCIPLSLYEKCGGYKETVRLDFADFQFQVNLRPYQAALKLIDLIAIQDFSNDTNDVKGLLHRYHLYLESAAAFTPDTMKLVLKHNYQVLRHGIALFVRTHNIKFLTNYIKIFLLKSK